MSLELTQRHSFLWLSNILLYMYHNFIIHSSVDGHLGGFHVLAIVNSAAMNSWIHSSFPILVSSGYMPRSGIAGSYGAFIPSFSRNLHTIFHSGCISLHCHQQCKSIPFFSTPSSAFIVCWLFDDGHSNQSEVISHCNFDLHFSNNKWCAFMCLWAISSLEKCLLSSLEKCLCRSFYHFLIGLFVFSVIDLCELLVYFGN